MSQSDKTRDRRGRHTGRLFDRGGAMPILMTADVPGQTREGYDRVFDALAPLYAAAPGFVAHLSHPIDDGWCVMDVWRTREDFERFFAQHVVSKLPSELRPKIRFRELHDAFTG
jgi:hypothetical protein